MENSKIFKLLEKMPYKRSFDKEKDLQFACCISPAKGIKIIGVISCVSGAIITFISWLSCYLQEEWINVKGIGSSIISSNLYMLLGIGLFQTSTSIWLLLAQRKRTAAIGWTFFHILSAITSIAFIWKFMVLEYEISQFAKIFLTFIAINLCFTTFNSLVMIELLIRPISEETFQSSYLYSSTESSRDNRSRREYKV